MSLFGEFVDEPFADEGRAVSCASEVEEVRDEVALAFFFECFGYVHHEFRRQVLRVPEECAYALEALGYVEEEVLELGRLGGDEVEVDSG